MCAPSFDIHIEVYACEAYLSAGAINNDYSSVGYSLLIKKKKTIDVSLAPVAWLLPAYVCTILEHHFEVYAFEAYRFAGFINKLYSSVGYSLPSLKRELSMWVLHPPSKDACWMHLCSFCMYACN